MFPIFTTFRLRRLLVPYRLLGGLNEALVFMEYWYSCLSGSYRLDTAVRAIKAAKDVDGTHPLNLGRLVMGLETVEPCTPGG